MFSLENCRICLKRETELLRTSTVVNNKCYNEELQFCVPEVEWANNEAPSLICSNCVKQLEISASFRRLCLESDSARKKFLKELAEQTAANLFTDGADHSSEETDLQNDFLEAPECNPKTVVTKYPPPKKERTCAFCQTKFSKYSALMNHIRSVHTFEKCFKCDVCNEAFTNSDILSRHKNRHTGERKYVCSYCGKKFFTNSDLNHHVQRHLNRRSYKCNICENKSFNTANCLRAHKLVVHTNPNEWKYLCTTCGRKCVTQTALTVHMKRHLNEKDFACHLCRKRFCTRSELVKHIPSHSNMRLHKCEVCGQEYKNRKLMEKHLTKKHGIGNAKIEERVKKHFCEICPKKFLGKGQLEKHLRSHSGERPFKCELCEQTFICNSYIKGHMKSKHSVDC